MEDPLAELTDRILYEDNHLIIVNKKPSEIVQEDRTGDSPLGVLVKRYLKEKFGKPGDVFLGVTHRIDRPVSGAVVFARTSKALSRINKMLKDQDLKKTYWAVVKKLPEVPSATLENYLLKREKPNKSFVVTEGTEGAKYASLTYKVIASSKHYHLLEIELHTGRHHQIRVQLSAMGSPVKGDLKYGYPRSNSDGSILLHARSLEFIHPVSKAPISVTAPLPDGEMLWKHFQLMGSGA